MSTKRKNKKKNNIIPAIWRMNHVADVEETRDLLWEAFHEMAGLPRGYEPAVGLVVRHVRATAQALDQVVKALARECPVDMGYNEEAAAGTVNRAWLKARAYSQGLRAALWRSDLPLLWRRDCVEVVL